MPHRGGIARVSVIRLSQNRHAPQDEPKADQTSDEYLRHQGISQERHEVEENNEYQGDLSESAHDGMSDV